MSESVVIVLSGIDDLDDLVLEGKPEILPAAGMYRYVKVRILQISFESVVPFSDGTQN